MKLVFPFAHENWQVSGLGSRGDIPVLPVAILLGVMKLRGHKVRV